MKVLCRVDFFLHTLMYLKKLTYLLSRPKLCLYWSGNEKSFIDYSYLDHPPISHGDWAVLAERERHRKELRATTGKSIILYSLLKLTLSIHTYILTVFLRYKLFTELGPFRVYNSMSFGVSKRLCSHWHHEISECFLHTREPP